MEGPKARAVAGPRAVEPDARAGAGAVRVKEPVLLERMLPALLGSTLSALLFGSLSSREPTDLGDADLGAEQREGFFQGAIAGGA